MWALLSDARHAAGFDPLGEAYAPLRRLVELLASREYAGRVYAFKSGASFNLTTAPTPSEAGAHDGLGIDYVPERGVFRVGYGERALPNRLPQMLNQPPRTCAPHEVGEVIDRHVRRMLLCPRPRPPESADAQAVLVLVMIAALFVFSVGSALMWAGIVYERVLLVSMGVCGAATAALCIGEARRPNWSAGRWHPRPGGMVSPPNRLTALGVGIWFGTGGAVFLGMAVSGPGHLPWFILVPMFAALATGAGLFLVGVNYAQREGEAARALRTALAEYANRYGGWFPRGEASPEASLGLLHCAYPELVTAAVLAGEAVPEETVQARLRAGELLTPETCGWHYVEGLRSDDDPRLALFWDKPAPGWRAAQLSLGARFVIFLGGSVECIPPNRWEEFLAEQEWLRAGLVR
jgi:hypothetical protein